MDEHYDDDDEYDRMMMMMKVTMLVVVMIKANRVITDSPLFVKTNYCHCTAVYSCATNKAIKKAENMVSDQLSGLLMTI